MAASDDQEISGLALLRQPATEALVRFLEDLRATIGFQAYLWRLIVKVDHGDPTGPPNPSALPTSNSAVAEMDNIHSALLDEMLFCRAVNSFLTYLADLMTLIYEKYPQKLPSDKKTTYRFCIEHHIAGDLVSALAEETVMELTHKRLDELAEYFSEKLDLVLFTKDEYAVNAALCVDIRNIITHNRSVINRFFIKRNPRYADELGKRVMVAKNERRDMLGTLGYCARQIDIRAIQQFGFPTVSPQTDKADDNE